jgi:hypothetical protein
LLRQAGFHGDEGSALVRGFELVMASGLLQLIGDWKSAVERLAGVATGFLHITRLPIVHHGKAIYRDLRPARYGYGTGSPGGVVSQQQFLFPAEADGTSLSCDSMVMEPLPALEPPEPTESRDSPWRPGR